MIVEKWSPPVTKRLPKRPITGFADLFGEQARLGAAVVSRLMTLLESWGYSRLQLPIVERAEAFSEEVIGHSPWPEWDTRSSFLLDVQNYSDGYRGVEGKTEALLIPEGTVSVARWLAGWVEGREAPFPLKVMYHCQCFRNEPVDKLSTTKLRQFEQVGMEILGSDDITADIETLDLVAEGLTILGVAHSHIRHRVSDIGIFNHLASGVAMDEQTRVALKESLDGIAEARAGGDRTRQEREQKTFMDTLQRIGQEGQQLTRWLALAETCTADVLKSHAAAVLPPALLEPIAERVGVLRRLGYDAVADLAVVRSHEYYTGMVMEIDVVEPGAVKIEVAGGGRYDRMIGAFVDSGITRIPAVGFAFGLQRLLELVRAPAKLQHVVSLPTAGEVDFVIERSNDYCSDRARAEALRARGLRVDLLTGNPAGGVHAYARRQGARVFRPAPDPLEALFSEAYSELFLQPRAGEVAEREIEALLGWIDAKDSPPKRFLDVPCGIGRHAVALARRGHTVVGIERSEEYRRKASEAARNAGVIERIEIREGDLRWLDLPSAAFDHATCLYNSLGYYDDADDYVLLCRLARALRPGGSLALEVLNRDWVLANYQDRRWMQDAASLLLESNRFDPATSSSVSEYCFARGGTDGAPKQFRFRLYSAHEIVSLLRKAGFAEITLASTLDGKAFDIRGSDKICLRATLANDPL